MHTRAEIEKRLKEIVVNQTNVNEEHVTNGASFLDDLGCDSLDVVELMMAIEEEFKDSLIEGEIPDSHAEQLLTFGDAVEYILSGGQKLPSSH